MKYILITGVSTGIGYTSVKFLLDKGFFVLGSVRKSGDAIKLEQEFGKNFKALVFDVTDDQAIQNAVSIAQQTIGNHGLTALINNAGVVVSGPMQHVPIEKLRHQFDVNILGVMRVTQAFLPMLGAVENHPYPPGRIIQISSVSGKITSPFLGPYCASKYALESISDALRRELFLFGIKVVIIEPGPIKTPIWDKALTTDNAEYDDTFYGSILNKRAKSMARIKESGLPPEDVSKTISKSIVINNPKTRYIVTKKSWMYKIYDLMPDKWLDNAITKPLKKFIIKK